MYHDPKIYPSDPVTEPVGDLRWQDKEHPCNGRFHWRWHAANALMQVEDFAYTLSNKANEIRRAVDPVDGTKAQARKAKIRRDTLKAFIVQEARKGDRWAIEQAQDKGLEF